MKKIFLIALAGILLPALAVAKSEFAVTTLAADVKETLQPGQVIAVYGPIRGEISACDEKYANMYKAVLTDDFGGSRTVIAVWGNGLLGKYRVEKALTDTSGVTCVVVSRLPVW